jgi:hypothetical protein
MKRLFVLLAVAVATAAFYAGPALAGETTWTGNGSENLPCAEGGHWILSPAQGITSATLTVNGVTYEMTQSGDGSFSADSVGSLDENTTASATWDGDNDTAFLKLSHCVQGTTTGTTTGGSGGVSGTTGGTGGSGGVSGTTGGTTGGVSGAEAGGELPFTGLSVWIPLLAGLGLLSCGYMLIRWKGRTSA